MAISWITALKLVPWGDVIEAAPQVIKAAKGLVRKKDAQAEASRESASGRISSSAATSSGERALELIRHLDERVQQLEQSQRQSLDLIEQLAEQNAQLVATVSALRTGAQRLAIACGVLGVALIGVVAYMVFGARA